MREKQIDKTNYNFSKYIHKRRFSSMWHQLDEILATQPDSVLEIGPGPGIFKILASIFGIKVETLDLDPELEPDHVGDIENMPFDDKKYDVVCAFQVLEHLPYDAALVALNEMVRVSRRYVIISLPDAKVVYRCSFQIPKIGEINLFIPKPTLRSKAHVFNGEHYWEINKKGYSLNKVIQDFSAFCKIEKTYRVNENPYHRFFILRKFS